MKSKMFLSCVVILLITSALLVGCKDLFGGRPVQHTFIQERANVEKVEICTYCNDSYPIGTITPICVLSDSEIDSMWDDLSNLQAITILPSQHPSRFGDLIFVVHYADGEQELIGFEEQGVIYADGTFGGYRGYAFLDERELAKVFAKYAEPESLIEVSESFAHWYSKAKE